MYVIFRVTPFSKNIARSILKSPKIYFLDVGLVIGDQGVCFENLVAVSLLKHCYASYDYLAEEISPHYLRIKEKHEVDFALVKDDKIQKMIEAKLTNHKLSKPLLYFKDKYELPSIQVVKNLRIEQTLEGIDIVRIERFLQTLLL